MLVTAGGTREPIDSVRALTNRSSGKMGFAVAAEVVPEFRIDGLPLRVTTRSPPRPRTGRRNATTIFFELKKMKRNTELPAERFTLAPAGVPVKKR